MLARTYKNKTYCTCGKALQALSACVVLMCASCASDTVIKEIEEIDTNGTDPMKFTCQVTDDVQQSGSTRASKPLTSGFMVSTYKSYAESTQQTVMDRYTVEYFTTGTAWDGTSRPYWDYTKVSGQIQRYWDYSHYPYRFHAIAPCPPNKSDFTLSSTEVKIPARYSSQNCTDGSVTPADNVAEPYLLSQVHRAADGKDTDILAQDPSHPEINTSSSTLNREVQMPFHHLNSKVRFAVYSLSPWVSANSLYVKDLTVKVSSTNFVTSASGFQATCDGTSNWRPSSSPYGFTGLTKDDTHPVLLSYTGVDSNGDPLPDNNLSENQTQRTANFLQCPNGMMQLPQDGVEMKVSLKLIKPDQTVYQELTDVSIKLDGESKFDWNSGYIYTYYLVISGIADKLSIDFTCTLTPWEDITGSLSTDLEQ